MVLRVESELRPCLVCPGMGMGLEMISRPVRGWDLGGSTII